MSSAAKMIMTIFGGIAEFERTLILSRTDDGRKAAKACGVAFGRPQKMLPNQKELARSKQGGHLIHPFVKTNLLVKNVQGLFGHGTRVIDDIEVGLVGALRLAHVHSFDQRVDVRPLDHAFAVRRWIGRVVFLGERGRVGHHLGQA